MGRLKKIAAALTWRPSAKKAKKGGKGTPRRTKEEITALIAEWKDLPKKHGVKTLWLRSKGIPNSLMYYYLKK